MAIRGYIELVTPELIEGWCYDDATPDRALDVTLYFNGRVVARGTADRHRPDLAEAGYGSGHHAFQFGNFGLSSDSLDRTVEVWAGAPAQSVVVALPHLQPRGLSATSESAYEPEVPVAARRLRQCILHIGLEKTGSSSLQRHLLLNRESLLAQRVLVPVALAQNEGRDLLNHSSLVAYALDVAKTSDDIRLAHGITSADEVSNFRRSVQSALLREVNELPDDVQTLVLSNEHLHSRLRDPSEIERLRRLLTAVCEDIQVYVYLRPQHRIAVSAHATLLKNGARVENPFPAVDPEAPWTETELLAYYDQDALIERWESVFGVGGVTPVRLNGAIETHFQTLLDVDSTGFTPLEERANVGLSGAGLAILRALNEEMQQLPHRQAQAIREELLPDLERHYAGFGAHGYGDAARAFQFRFTESNDRLRARHFSHLPSLYDDDWAIYEAPAVADATDTAGTVALLRRLIRLTVTKETTVGGDTP